MTRVLEQTHPFAGARKMKPTLKHRPAVWEGILGTVYAYDDTGCTRYFDYDWDAAREYAGVRDDRDLRLARSPRRYGAPGGPRKGQLVLWVLR